MYYSLSAPDDSGKELAVTEISDSSEGGWWQASDGLWYPPEAADVPPPPPPPSSPKRRSKVWVLAVVGVTALIAAVGAVLAFSGSDGTTDNTAEVVSSSTTTASPPTTAAPTTTISAAQRAAQLGLDCEITDVGSGRIGSLIWFDASATNPLNSRVQFKFAVDVFYTPSQLAIDSFDIKNPSTSWMGSDDYMLSDDTPSGQTASASGYIEATEPILNFSELECEIYELEYQSSSGFSWVSLFSR